MEIYLIRHTTPAIKDGICYGQSDLDVEESFLDEATKIKNLLPAEMQKVYSSPLRRCKVLTTFLYPTTETEYHDGLKEIDCGQWENKKWDEINQPILSAWMKDFVNVCFPGGENFIQLASRVNKVFEMIGQSDRSPVAIVTHGGVIRSILCSISLTPLEQAFKVFKLGFGSIVRIRGIADHFDFKFIN